MRSKGATHFDKLCHKVFDANVMDYRPRYCGARCRCGQRLEVYYCEERLYVVKCCDCEVMSLVHARSPRDAAYKTLAHRVLSVEEMDDRDAVFFDHAPIDEPPVYVGSLIDCDFPSDVVCGMYLPCPATGEPDIEGGNL